LLAVLAFLIAYNMWTYFTDPFRFLNLGRGVALALSVLTSVLFVASILAHELAHAAVFRLRGIPVLGVTLHMFGGVTQGGAEARRPWDEFIVAVAGPVTTGLLGGAFLLARESIRSVEPDPWRAMFGYLGVLNIIIAGFNLLPGFPLDGGRVLLAGLWRFTGDRDRANRMAARAGQGVAVLIGGVGVVDLVRNTGTLWGIWPLMIGLMLFQSSSGALAQGRRRATLETATAGQIMSPPPPSVAADLPISVALERHLLGHDGEAFPVMDQGRVVGFISPRMAKSVPLDKTVRDAMVGTETAVMAEPEESMSSLIRRIEGDRIQTILVMKDGRLIGVIEPEDMNRFFHRKERR
jgi:Zn-dependent protease/predicted transcriptional regulator